MIRKSITLTDRQIEILKMLEKGMTEKEISHELNLKQISIKSHIDNIMIKMGADTRLEAVIMAKNGKLI